jgi:serpin B
LIENHIKGEKMKKKVFIMGLIIGVLLVGCSTNKVSKNSKNFTADIEREDVSSVEITAPSYAEINPREEITDFSLDVLREKYKDENILISPLSIVSALGMTANGAKNNTLVQMEDVLNSDTNTLNDFLEA